MTSLSSPSDEHSSTDPPHPTSHPDHPGRTLNPRSCVTCRRRKVKCDRIHPCTNCNRAHTECVFPAPGRAPRKKRVLDSRDKELLERLRRLEGVVKGMGVEVSTTTTPPPNTTSTSTTQDGRLLSDGRNLDMDCSRRESNEGETNKTGWVEEQRPGGFENRFGRLVVNQGRSRYVNNSFWASLSNEVEDIKEILHQSSDEEGEGEVLGASPDSGGMGVGSGAAQGWMFGFSSQNVDMLSLHPLPNQLGVYWDVYKDRVDPLVKVLHIPSMEPTILKAASHLSDLPKGFECLLFSIYYAVATSLSPQDCLSQLGEEKSILLSRYRFGVEQALARANFLTTEEMVVLQAFVIFLLCLKRNSDGRVIWTLTGLVVRIAETIGIHRDGSHFDLSPFDVEMRRRLWWQVCILDTRASEDHGCDPTITEQTYDTKFPSNLNDADISPGMVEMPPEKQGCTDVTFCLIRYEVSSTFRRLNYVPPGIKGRPYLEDVPLSEKEQWINECHNRLEEKYLKDCDMTVPLYWVTATVARLMMSKMWLMVYHPYQRQSGGKMLPAEIKEKLFITSLENIEYSVLLETEARTMKWGWLFRTYMQWHALAFLLSELCHRTSGDLCERAWRAVENVIAGHWAASDVSKAGHLWRPLKKLYRKAKEAHKHGLAEEASRNANQRPVLGQQFPDPTQHREFVRAPLSQAQATRFAQGPAYAQIPLDKHLIMSNSGTQSLEAANPQLVEIDLAHAPVSLMTDDMIDPQNSGTDGFFAEPSHYPAQSPLNQSSANTSFWNTARTDSVDSLTGSDPANDLNIMDTSGDLNWDNWDQLVRQFGMDIDTYDAANNGTSDVDVPTTINPNMRGFNNTNNTGIGLGGNSWF